MHLSTKPLFSIPKLSFNVFLSIVILANLIAPYSVSAHETETTDTIPFESIYSEILNKLANLEFDELPENSHNFETYIRGSKKYVFVGPRSYIKVDNAFYGLVGSIGKLYLSELKKACEDCILPSVESINSEVEALIAKGWFAENSKRTKEILAYRFASAFVSLGGRYGKVAGVLKLVGELVEEATLWLFHLPGMHVLCEVVTAGIALFAGKTNTLYRVYANDLSKYSNILGPAPSLRAIGRLAATSLVMRRSMKRMSIGVRPFEIDEEALKDFVEEEKETKLVYRVRSGFSNSAEHHRVTKFLRYLQKKADKVASKSGAKIESAMYYHEINRKIYRGSKYLFVLKERRRFNSVGPFADESGKFTNGNRSFWLVGLQNDILDPLTNIKDLESDLGLKKISFKSTELDSITKKQVSQYSLTNQDAAEDIFRSLDAITDYEGQTFKQRRIELAFFQSYISGVVPKLLNKMLVAVLDQFEDDKKRIMPIYDLFFKEGSITYYAEQLVDFLRFAAAAKSESDPFIKYHVRDYYLKLNEALEIVALFNGARTIEDVQSINSLLKIKLHDLSASLFWIEKRSRVGLIPDGIKNITNFVFHPIRHPAEKIKDGVHFFNDFIDFRKNRDSSNENFKRPTYQTGAPSCESLYL
jgi:hypothetical protein